MSSCIAINSAVSATTFLIGSAALIDCGLRDVAPVLAKFRLYQFLTALALLIRDATLEIDFTYIPGTVGYLHILLGLIAMVYLLENFLEVLSKIDMVTKPKRLLIFWRYFRAFIGLFLGASLIAFLVNPIQATEFGRYVVVILFSLCCLYPAAYISGKIAWILTIHIRIMDQACAATDPLHDDKMRRFRKARRQCIMLCVVLLLFTPFNIYGAVNFILTLAQDPSARYRYRSCEIRFAYFAVHAIYWLGYYLTRSPHSKRRPWFNKHFPKDGTYSSTQRNSKNSKGSYVSSATTGSGSTNVETSREPAKRLNYAPTSTLSESTDPTPSVVPRHSQTHSSPQLIAIARGSTDTNLAIAV